MVDGSIRRVVTGHDDAGNAIIIADGAPQRAVSVGGAAGPTFFEIWNTPQAPSEISRREGEPLENGLVLAPPNGGTRIRVIDFPPESDEIKQLTDAQARAQFESMGGAQASTAGARHPLMHRTETIDYAIVLHGELILLLDNSETLLHAGDIVVQRGTNHAWANRSDSICRVAFVLIDARYSDGLALDPQRTQ